VNSIFSLSGIRIGSFQINDGHIFLQANSKHKYAHCPCCNEKSKRVHSSYVRVLRDLPISTRCSSIHLTVRKFFCKNPVCKRKIFAEQPGPEIKAYSRMTFRTRKLLQDLFLEVSARKGSYLSGLISLPVSPSTGLRLIGSLPIPTSDFVNVLGVDDWAYRKGQSYGTILVDIEQRQVIDLVPERDGVSLKKWLGYHPEVSVVTRDRASAYSSAVSATLPNAIQVADRFHLLMNFSDCIYDVIRSEYKNLSNSLNENSSQECTITTVSPNEESGKVPQKEKGEMNDYMKGRFDKVKEMLKDGHAIKAIAKSLKMSRITIRSYSNMDILPNKGIHLRNNYGKYQDIIEKEFSEGKNLTAVFDSIKKAGFKGGLSSFWEQYKDHPMRTNSVKTLIPTVKNQLISPRKLTRYLQMADLSKIKDKADSEIMASLLNKNALLDKLRFQALTFKEMLLANDDSLLDGWIKRTLAIEKSRLRTFVNGLNSDIDAVRNAIVTNWSNGQVEGQVNRLKSIKRQMYGRAGFELLRRKVILSRAG